MLSDGEVVEAARRIEDAIGEEMDETFRIVDITHRVMEAGREPLTIPPIRMTLALAEDLFENWSHVQSHNCPVAHAFLDKWRDAILDRIFTAWMGGGDDGGLGEPAVPVEPKPPVPVGGGTA